MFKFQQIFLPVRVNRRRVFEDLAPETKPHTIVSAVDNASTYPARKDKTVLRYHRFKLTRRSHHIHLLW